MLVDTHAHLQFYSFHDDREMVIERTLNEGISFIIPSTQIDTSRAAVELAEKLNNPRVYSSIGLHPIHVNKNRVDEDEVGRGSGLPVISGARRPDLPEAETRGEEFNRTEYEKLIHSEKVVAVGEIGLDYWRKPKTTARKQEFIKRQKDAFIAQLDLAFEYKKPLILHCRVAHDDMIDILRNHSIVKNLLTGESPGVVHSFTGNIEQLNKFLKMGFYIGVNGLVFNLPFVREAVSVMPLEKIVLETDAPYLLPPQVTKTKRNEPIYVKYTAERIAEIKEVSFEEVAKQTTENAQKVFRVDFI